MCGSNLYFYILELQLGGGRLSDTSLQPLTHSSISPFYLSIDSEVSQCHSVTLSTPVCVWLLTVVCMDGWTAGRCSLAEAASSSSLHHCNNTDHSLHLGKTSQHFSRPSLQVITENRDFKVQLYEKLNCVDLWSGRS